MQRGIIGLFFKNSEFNIMPKALNQWKAWVAERKRVKQKVLYTMNSMHHPLHKAFQKWKYDMTDNQNKLLPLSKG